MKKLVFVLALVLFFSSVCYAGTWTSLGDKGSSLYSMAVYDGNLFTGDFDGILGTYNSTSGVWSSLGDKGSSLISMAVYDGNLFTGDNAGVLGTYNSTSGVWSSLGVKGSNFRSMAVYDGNLFTGDLDGVLGTYNSTSGVWSSLGDKGSSFRSMAVYAGNLFTGDLDGVLGTYDSTSGVWSSLGDKGSDLISMAVYDGNLFTGDYDGILGTYYIDTRLSLRGDLSTHNILKGGSDINANFAVFDFDNNASDFLVDFNLSIDPSLGQGDYIVFADLNLAIDFNAFGGQDTNDLGLGFDVNFTFPFVLPSWDVNVYACINLKDRRNDLNYGKCASVSIMIDSTAPNTTWNKDANFWYSTNQTITLTRTDNNSGVFLTKYRYKNLFPTEGSFIPWQTYTSPIVITTEGKWHWDFNSIDNVGNDEDLNTVFLFIDKTRPTISSDVNNNTWNLIGDANLQMTAYDALSGIDANWVRIDDCNTSQNCWGTPKPFDLNVLIDFATYGDGNFGVQYWSTDFAKWDSNSDVNSSTVFVLLDVNGPRMPDFITPISGSYTGTILITCAPQIWIRDINYAIDFNTNGIADWNQIYVGASNTYLWDSTYLPLNSKVFFRCKAIDADKNGIYYTAPTNIIVNVDTGFDSISNATPLLPTTIYSASAPFSVTATDASGVDYCTFKIYKNAIWVVDVNGTPPVADLNNGIWRYTYTSVVTGDVLYSNVFCGDACGNQSAIISSSTYSVSITIPPPPLGGGGGIAPTPLGKFADYLSLIPSGNSIGLLEGIEKPFSIRAENVSEQEINVSIKLSDNIAKYFKVVQTPFVLQPGELIAYKWLVFAPTGQMPTEPISGTITFTVEGLTKEIPITLTIDNPLFAWLYNNIYGLPIIALIIIAIVGFIIWRNF